jgi:hypothetical protein
MEHLPGFAHRKLENEARAEQLLCPLNVGRDFAVCLGILDLAASGNMHVIMEVRRMVA